MKKGARYMTRTIVIISKITLRTYTYKMYEGFHKTTTNVKMVHCLLQNYNSLYEQVF